MLAFFTKLDNGAGLSSLQVIGWQQILEKLMGKKIQI